MNTGLDNTINEIPWTRLRDAYGSADTLRDLIRQVATVPDEADAENIYIRIYRRICHQGVLEEAVPVVVPALVALLNLDGVRAKDVLLDVLSALLVDHAMETGMPGLLPVRRDFDLKATSTGETRAAEQAYRRRAHDAFAAVEQHVPVFFSLLADSAPRVRAQAVRLSAFFRTSSETALEQIHAAYVQETEVHVRASALVSLGILSGQVPSEKYLDVFDRALEDPVFLVRAAGAVAHVYAHSGEASDALWRVLEAAACARREPPDLFPWAQGAIAGLAAEALTMLAPVDRERAVASLLRAVECQVKEGDEAGEDLRREWPLPYLVAEHLVAMTFERFERRTDEVVLEELDEEQRRTLKRVGSDLGVITWAQRYRGIPHTQGSLRRFLGLVPFGPLDRKVKLAVGPYQETWPIWKWWRVARRGQIDEAALVDHLLDVLDTEEVFALCTDMVSGAYDPGGYVPHAPVPLAMMLIDRIAEQEIAKIEAYAHELLEEGATTSQCALAMVPLLRYGKDHGRAVNWTYRPLLEQFAAYSDSYRSQIIALLPEEERDRL
ncbi:MAG: HEAT repeat domain-containing protein [Rhodothermales bacterium]